MNLNTPPPFTFQHNRSAGPLSHAPARLADLRGDQEGETYQDNGQDQEDHEHQAAAFGWNEALEQPHDLSPMKVKVQGQQA